MSSYNIQRRLWEKGKSDCRGVIGLDVTEMERIKALVTGKNKLVIDDLYNYARDILDLLWCSARYEDRVRHIDLFAPDVFIICLNGETEGEMSSFAELKRKLTSIDAMTVVVGGKEECEAFKKRAIQMADLVLVRPITIEVFKQEIVKLMEQVQRQKEEQAAMLEALAKLKATEEKKHVLVVDDDPLMLKVVKEYLGDSYNVATAISGKIARKFLENKETNLILLDYEMPGETGKEVLEKLREDTRLANVPVIFLTGVTDREKLMDVLALKPQGYLLKPVDKEKLLGTLEKFIG